MLAPRERSLLLEALRPPSGYRLGRAIATTYTLDLLALLTAPLAFTFFDWEDEEGRPSANPLALLEAVRRHARKLHVFCHGGAIQVPKRGQVLFAHLEPCVVEVAAPRGGVFHPKLWVLRFEPEPGTDEPVRFRLLVGTRNLTFDRSWDTLLQLEGELVERRNAISMNRPLAEFVAALPGLAIHGAPPRAEAAAREFADQLQRVRWELPRRVKGIEFLPLGLGRRTWPFDGGRQRLVMAPFLDAWFLERFGAERRDGIVVSRPDALQEAASGLRGYQERFVLADGTDGEGGFEAEAEADGEGGAAESPGTSMATEDTGQLSGLHAKLFVLDDGHRTQVYTGSANGTRAAFERNVEFLVRLDATKQAMGIEALLGRDERGALHELLEAWHPMEVEVDEERALRGRLERAAEAARQAVVAAELRLELRSVGSSSHGGNGSRPHPSMELQGESTDRGVARDGGESEFILELHGELPDLEGGVQLTSWPVVLSPRAAVALEGGSPLARFAVSLGAATAFLAFEVVAREAGLEHRIRFARRLSLGGLPEDRDERLLRALLKDRETVMRLLYLLLSAEEISAETLTAFATGEGAAEWRSSDYGLPLFEPLVRALARGPEALEPVERLVADLARTEEGRALLPEGFEELWGAVRAAREELAR